MHKLPRSRYASLPTVAAILVKNIDGVDSLVVWDVDTGDGLKAEAELAFVAQDKAGNAVNDRDAYHVSGVYRHTPPAIRCLPIGGLALSGFPPPADVSRLICP